jgi:hypothetical protein
MISTIQLSSPEQVSNADYSPIHSQTQEENLVKLDGAESKACGAEGEKCLRRCWQNDQQRAEGDRCLIACWSCASH